MKLQRRPDLLWEQLGRSVALLDKQRAQAHSLDGTAAAVWVACDGSCERADVVTDVVAAGFDADEVDAAIDALVELELFVVLGVLDRRAVLRRGLGAVSIGAVLSIALPEPAAALSTGAPAPELLNKTGWSLTGTQGDGGVVLSIDSVSYPPSTPDLQFAKVSITAQPDYFLTWGSVDNGSGVFVFNPFVVADETWFMVEGSPEQTAWATATELSVVFYDFSATPQVVGWAYYPNRY